MLMEANHTIACFILLLSLSLSVYASIGDRSQDYLRCLGACHANCSNGVFDGQQSTYMKLMGWSCLEECKYSCMWVQVEVFEQHKMPCRQFHGKWPFVRILGAQEPASSLFSILNGASNLLAFSRYRKAVPSDAPMFKVAAVQAAVNINGWFWSTVFHARDFPWTERLDYFCATSMVAISFYVSLHRWTYEASSFERTARYRWLSGHVIFALYVGHVAYLSLNRFDYGYNMKANVCVALFNAASLLSFCWYKRRSHAHVRKLATAVILTMAFLSFELLDFAPILWTLDAHAIWHLLTVPMSLVLFSFYEGDHLALDSAYRREKKIP